MASLSILVNSWIVKSVQSALSDLKRLPERLQVPVQLSAFHYLTAS